MNASWLERSIALAAWLTAVAALAVSIWQGVVTRQHQRLSVQPELTFVNAQRTGEFTGISVSNEGLGPAVMHRLLIYADGKMFDSWESVLAYLGLQDIARLLTLLPTSTKMPIKSGSMREVFGIRHHHMGYGPTEDLRVRRASGQLNLVVCYCSMYNDCTQASISEMKTDVCK